MRDGWRETPIGEIAELDIEKVPVVPEVTYRIAGVLNGGQGMLDRGTIVGAETNYPFLHRLRADQLVMRKLTAWEGPITVVPSDFDGAFVSPEFPSFMLDRRRVVPAYLQLYCRLPSFWDRMRASVTGTVQRRKRLNPDQLLSIKMWLPPLAEQRRIVDLIAAVDASIDRAGSGIARAEQLLRSRLVDAFGHVPGGNKSVAELLRTSIGGVWGGDQGDSEVDVRVYRSTEFTNHGELKASGGVIRSITRRQLDSRRLREGDILLEKSGGGPNQPVGRVVFVKEVSEPAVCANFVQLLSPDPAKVEPAFLFWMLYAWHLVGRTEEFQQRTTGLRNLRTQDYLALPIELPDRTAQQELVALLDAVAGLRDASMVVKSHHTVLRSAVLADLLSGAHEIPESYDALLEGAPA